MWIGRSALFQYSAVPCNPYYAQETLILDCMKHAWIAFVGSHETLVCSQNRNWNIRIFIHSFVIYRINQECYQAFTLAVHNFFDQAIAPACVAFIEILGMDSAPLRLHLEVASTISLYLTSALSDKSNKMIQKLQHFIGMYAVSDTN